MAIPRQNATTRRVRSGPKMSVNSQFWKRMYFPTKYLHSYPQSLFYTELSVSRTLMELKSWNFTVPVLNSTQRLFANNYGKRN